MDSDCQNNLVPLAFDLPALAKKGPALLHASLPKKYVCHWGGGVCFSGGGEGRKIRIRINHILVVEVGVRLPCSRSLVCCVL
jgi:hypothetical protein